jgi:succinoglycan biosynthesis protein ExoV
MKLFYYQRPDGLRNFGDWLNPWLWERLLPRIFDGDETTAFIGIGTLLNHLLPQRVPQAQKLVIFSTGAGYEQKLTSPPDSWQIYCVRGLLSARQLGLGNKLAITDGAVLVRRLFEPTGEKTSAFAFMPHVHHAKTAGTAWEWVCRQVGFQYIDPCWPVERVLSAISRTGVLLAEAMHGAIVADALRVPWIPTITSPRILTFKWQDWCSSLPAFLTN